MPDVTVSCEWIVLLRGNDEKDIVLDVNEDAARYLTDKQARGQFKLPLHSTKAPVYPPEARRLHLQGSVKMMAHITPNGHVDNVEVISGPEMLRDSAVRSVKDWVYEPLIIGSNAVPVGMIVTIHFRMSE